MCRNKIKSLRLNPSDFRIFLRSNRDNEDCGELKPQMITEPELTRDQKEMIDLKADLDRKKLDLKELKFKGNYSRDDFLNGVQAVNISRNNIAVSKANNRMDIYELLTAEQKKTFDKMGDRTGKHRKMIKHYRQMND